MKNLTKKKLLSICAGLLSFNLLLATLIFNLDDSTYEHLDGTKIEAHSAELIRSVILGQVISIPILSIVIGLIVAIFIDRKLPYGKRIVRGFLLTLTVIYGLFTIMGLTRIIVFF